MFYKYHKLIKCTRCGKNYKGIRDNKKNTYICSGYTNYGRGFCTRGKVDEEEIDFLTRHNQHKKIKIIYIDNFDIKVIYEDNTYSLISESEIIF